MWERRVRQGDSRGGSLEEKEEKKEKEESKEIFLRADIQTDINGNTRGPRGHKKLFYAHKI